jgi:hypothetical protein
MGNSVYHGSRREQPHITFWGWMRLIYGLIGLVTIIIVVSI